MNPVPVALALLLVGCSLGSDNSPQAPDADGGTVPPPADSASPPGCQVSLHYSPESPIAAPSAVITVASTVLGAPGTLAYEWHVRLNGVPVNFSRLKDDTQIEFITPDTGVYIVDLAVTSSLTFCSPTSATINVAAAEGRRRRARLRVVAPPGKDAVPLDDTITIVGGASNPLGTKAVHRGMRMNRIVTGPNGPLPAYLRFTANGKPDAIIEAFSDSTGHASVVIDDSMYTVLIVPSTPGAVARKIVNWTAANPFLVTDVGREVVGDVRDPAGAAVGGAKVQLTIDGVPSTLATTAADGRFQLLAPTNTGPVTVEIVPPATTGLPQLTATSETFDLAAPMTVRYAATLARRDLASTRVLRDGAPVGRARVTVVGSMTDAGTVRTGTGAPANARGEVRISASADGSGALPAMRVPSATLSAVIEIAPGDLAVAALGTDDVPASLDAPPMSSLAITLVNADGTALPGAVLDLVPRGPLAMAGVPVLHVTADASSAIRAGVAAAGRYDLRFRDPAGRAASLVVTDRTATMIEQSYRLPPRRDLIGSVTYNGQPLANASLQVLCSELEDDPVVPCTGIERARPVAEAVSNAAGNFVLAVPDPGTM